MKIYIPISFSPTWGSNDISAAATYVYQFNGHVNFGMFTSSQKLQITSDKITWRDCQTGEANGLHVSAAVCSGVTAIINNDGATKTMFYGGYRV